jgi:hypothetical protein
MASVARIRVEPIIADSISAMQRGFLRFKMLCNVLDVDMHSMKISLKTEKGLLVLFDFEDGFPSISQEYLMNTLEKLGVPTLFGLLPQL